MQIEGQANLANSDNREHSIDSSSNNGENLIDGLSNTSVDIEALQAEVLKWQERVPKLAAALRERTDELALARDALRQAQSASNAVDTGSAPSVEDADARLRTRDELIAELQGKVTELNEKHRAAAGELHTTQLDLAQAQEEALGWQEKWQSVTATLDSSVADATRNSSEMQASLQRVQQDNENLLSRNGKLQESIDLANKQIAALGDDMQSLMAQVKDLEDEAASLREKLVAEDARYEQAMQAAESEQNQLFDKLQEKDRATQDMQTQLDALTVQADEAQTQRTQLQSQLEEAQLLLSEKVDLAATKDAQIATLEQQNAALQNQIEELGHAQNETQQAATQAQQEVEQLRGQLELQQAQLAEQTENQQRLQQRLETDAQESQRLQTELTAAQALAAAAETEAQAQLDKLNAKEAEFVELQQAQHKLVDELAAAQTHEQEARAKLAENETQLTKLQEQLDSRDSEVRGLLADSEAATEQAQTQLASAQDQVQNLEAEVERLARCVADAQSSQAQRDEERRELAAKVDELGAENKKLKDNLQERSAIVRELEAERSQRTNADTQVAEENTRLAQELTQAQHKLETFQEHARTLEGKLVSQQGLMTELENELSESQVSAVAAAKAAEQAQRETAELLRRDAQRLAQLEDKCDDLSQRNAHLLEQANQRSGRLESLQQELELEREARKQQQNAVYALQEELEKVNAASTPAAAPPAATPPEVSVPSFVKGQAEPSVAEEEPSAETAKLQLRELQQLLRERTEELDQLRWRMEQQSASADESVVMILNQQLADSREENKRLREKIALHNATAEADDLTALKGIGEKLVEQLAGAGITEIKQIAELDLHLLAEEDHPLHSLRSRIVRDEWIEQAQALLATRA